MFIKNVSFEVVEAVGENPKDIKIFQPQEILEVTPAMAERYMQRYNVGKMYFQTVEMTTPVAAPVAAEPLLPEEEESFVCQICGRIAASKAGLVAHMRSHA